MLMIGVKKSITSMTLTPTNSSVLIMNRTPAHPCVKVLNAANITQQTMYLT